MLKIDVEGMQSAVNTKIGSATTLLRQARNSAASVTVPSGFSRAGDIKSLPSKIMGVSESLLGISDSVFSVATGFVQSESRNKSLIDSLIYGFLNSISSKNLISDFFYNITSGESAKAFVSFFANVGAKISNAYENSLLKPVGDFLVSTGASAGNMAISALKGVLDFGQGIVKAGTMLVTGVATIGTGIYDLATGGEATKQMWDSVMGFVAEDYVGSAYNEFYKNTVIGKWLDENAFDAFKSDGIISNVVQGVGYVSGVVLATVATAGVAGVAIGAGSAATAGISAGFAGAAAFGNTTGEFWGDKRDEVWSGIENAYENGEISKELYDTYFYINDDKNWLQIEADYRAGKITEQEYELMKNMRGTLNSWKNPDNLAKGITYGAVNGAWEGLQWYLGGAVISNLSKAPARVALDSLFNAADTPTRALMENLITGKNFEQAWNEQGGWSSLITNLGIGLVGSSGGELFNKFNMSNNVKNTDEFFDMFKGTNGEYGCNQGGLTNLFNENYEEYTRMQSKLMNVYNFSAQDADKFMHMIDSVGACNYARSINSIFEAFKDKPGEYEKLFGFPMYVESYDGTMQLNYNEALVDLYYWGNAICDEAELIKVNNGISSIPHETVKMLIDGEEKDVVPQRGGSFNQLNDYLQYKAKNSNVEVQLESHTIREFTDPNITVKQKKEMLQDLINSGENLSIGGTGYTVRTFDGEINQENIGGHWIKITGYNDEGIIVPSWGKKSVIPYETIFSLDENHFCIVQDTYTIS